MVICILAAYSSGATIQMLAEIPSSVAVPKGHPRSGIIGQALVVHCWRGTTNSNDDSNKDDDDSNNDNNTDDNDDLQ